MNRLLPKTLFLSAGGHFVVFAAVFASLSFFSAKPLNLSLDIAYNFVPLGNSVEKERGLQYQVRSEEEGSHSLAGKSEAKGEAGGIKNLKEYYLSKNKPVLAAQIRNHLLYPHLARMRGYCGTVFVSFILTESGQITDVRLLKSSGHTILDESAMQTIASLTGLPKPAKTIELQIPIKYSIED